MSALPSPDSITTMVNSVTGTMMNLKFALAKGPTLRAPFRRAVLPIPGATPVSVIVTSDKQSCEKLGARLFMVSPAAVDTSMMEDTLRELANITAGQVRRAMSLDQALGLPKILTGDESWTVAVSKSQCITLRATEADVELEVQITTHPRE
ncbi:MAG: chemotaxis protein CheX [Myxococcaceae bacterium]|nr:chemotaxis protein CheX [Myxococcaceae bacterium]